jgi:SAM-dependent methyltransferase
MLDLTEIATKTLELLRCPDCGATFEPDTSRSPEPSLRCSGCCRNVSLRNGVLRFLDNEDLLDEQAQHTQASFGYEWSHFNDWKPSGETNFEDYFGRFDLKWLRGRTVLDAGCGMGRHARQIAPFAGGVIAIDFSRAIDAAAHNVADRSNVQCLQADLTRLPLAENAFDFVYSMGVLHHLADTRGVLVGLVRVLKPGGRLRLYLYWKRQGMAGVVLSLVTLTRKLTIKLPFPLLRGLCWLLSVFLTVGVITPYRLINRLGLQVREEWPLSVYAKYPFTVLYNDQFDRFSAPIEKRYTREEVGALLKSVGLRDVQVHSRFGWIGDGIK